MKYPTKSKEIKENFSSLYSHKDEDRKIKMDSLILMSHFLSEIEMVQKQKNIKRNKLAELIKTSGSYLTQVFNGDKPLNFMTVAKIQDVLGIGFRVHAYYKKSIIEETFNHNTSDELDINRMYKPFPNTKYDYMDFEKSYSITKPSTATIPVEPIILK